MTVSDLPVEGRRPWPGTSRPPVRLSRPHRRPSSIAKVLGVSRASVYRALGLPTLELDSSEAESA